MKEAFRIKGGKYLTGDVYVQGSKNAALKLISATLLTDQSCRLHNVPRLKDIDVMLEILKSMGAEVSFRGNTVIIKCAKINPNTIPRGLFGELRASVVFIGPLLARFGEVNLPYPGGDKIGKRSLTTHFNAFRDLGYKVIEGKSNFKIIKQKKLAKTLKLVLDEFSVTATENVLMWAANHPGQTEVSIVAEEPHIQNLVELLQKMGADIDVFPSHRILIKGKKKLLGTNFKVYYDYVEAGTWLIAGTLLANNLHIHNFPTQDLVLLIRRLERIGANITLMPNNVVRVKKSSKLSAFKWDVRLHPGIASDLQSPLGVLATQCHGTSEIFDTLYEGRLGYLKELQKMGANVKILDVHRAEIKGPSKLKGANIAGKDIRSGMSLIIAGLLAKGETILEDTYQVDRGYEDIDGRLRALGAQIDRA